MSLTDEEMGISKLGSDRLRIGNCLLLKGIGHPGTSLVVQR